MEITDQALSLAGSLALGAALGMIYDLFRVLRVRLRLPGLGNALDVLFWAVATITLFVWSVISGGGVVRIYIALGLLAGCWVWFRLLSRWFLFFAYRVADICALLAHILLSPVRMLRTAAKKVKKIFENPFHYGRSWYKIESLWKNDTFRRHWPGEEGDKPRENNKSQSDHQMRDLDFDRVPLHHPPERQEPTPDRQR